MTKKERIANYRSQYPEVELSDTVLDVLIKSDRKIEFYEGDLKRPYRKKNSEDFLPSRETSLESLEEMGSSFSAGDSVEETADRRYELSELRRCFSLLNRNQRWILDELFFHMKSEAGIAENLGITQQSVSRRKKRALKKLRSLIKTEN